MADVDRVFQVEMRGHRREVVGVVIHVMTVGHLGGAAMTAAIMRDDAIALQEEHICASQSSADSGQPWLNTMGCPLPQSL